MEPASTHGRGVRSVAEWVLPVVVVHALVGACLGCGFSAVGWSIVSELLSLLVRAGFLFLHGGWMDSVVLIS